MERPPLEASPSDAARRNLPHYFTLIVKVKFVHPTHLVTEHACHHNSCWRSRCDSNHAPTISLKLVHFHGDFGIPFRHTFSSRHTSLLTSDHPRHLELFRPYFLLNLHISVIPTKINFSRLTTQNILKTNQNVQMFQLHQL